MKTLLFRYNKTVLERKHFQLNFLRVKKWQLVLWRTKALIEGKYWDFYYNWFLFETLEFREVLHFEKKVPIEGKYSNIEISTLTDFSSKHTRLDTLCILAENLRF